VLTMKEVDDGSQVGSLLDQVATSVASFTADGVHDQDSMSVAAAERHPEAAITMPPRSTAVPSETAETAPPLPFQPLRGWNLEQLRPRSGTTTFSSSNREVRRTSPSTAEPLGRRRPDTPSVPVSRRPSAGSSR